jgi:hypothetical protein
MNGFLSARVGGSERLEFCFAGMSIPEGGNCRLACRWCLPWAGLVLSLQTKISKTTPCKESNPLQTKGSLAWGACLQKTF